MAQFSVDRQSASVAKMAQEWAIIDALMGGTPTMRAAGESLLPRWPNEEQASYDARLKVATLFPAFMRTVSVMAGKPFSKPLAMSEDTPSQIVEWSKDIDKEGVNLHSFAAEMFAEIMATGFAGILVEAPKPITGANGRAPTQREQAEAGIRPYWVRVKHDRILGGRIRNIGGRAVLTQLRIAECGVEDDGDYGDKEVKQIRVLTPGAWEIQEQRLVKGQLVWVKVDGGKTGLPFIPFVPLYGVRVASMIGRPPLLELAYLNVKHWQSQSDQDTILHVARVPILFAKGLGDSAITVGASTAIRANDSEHADLYFVEHTGKAIEAGAASLEALEAQMIQSGAELLVAKPGGRTATEDMNDAEANKCDLQRMAEGYRDQLNLALYYTSQYSKLPGGGSVTLFNDYAAGSLSDASAQLVLLMQQSGVITKRTLIREQQRRGVLSGEIDPEKEIAAAGEEGPAPGDDIDDPE